MYNNDSIFVYRFEDLPINTVFIAPKPYYINNNPAQEKYYIPGSKLKKKITASQAIDFTLGNSEKDYSSEVTIEEDTKVIICKVTTFLYAKEKEEFYIFVDNTNKLSEFSYVRIPEQKRSHQRPFLCNAKQVGYSKTVKSGYFASMTDIIIPYQP